jgi:hypothetical protein
MGPLDGCAGTFSGRLLAGGAEPQDVDPVTVGSETFGVGEGIELIGDGSLERRRGGDVDDLAAPGTEEMVVVLRQVLDQLEAGELVVGGHASHNRSSLKVNEVAVGRATRQVGELVGDIADADRVAHADEEIDNGSAAGRVTLVDASETRGDHRV